MILWWQGVIQKKIAEGGNRPTGNFFKKPLLSRLAKTASLKSILLL